MNEEKKIKVTIDPMGRPTVEAVGFNGVGCTDATSAIEKALAASDEGVTRVLKPEWHETESAGTDQHVHSW